MEAPQLTLSAKTLVVLCGPAGSGKTTFAREQFTPTQIVSSDGCRMLISDSERYAGSQGDVFALFHLIIQQRLKRGRRTCADSTAVYAYARRPLLEMAKEAGFQTCLLLFTAPLALCMQRTMLRERQVPTQVIQEQWAALHAARRQQIPTEGWDQVHEVGEQGTSMRVLWKGQPRPPRVSP